MERNIYYQFITAFLFVFAMSACSDDIIMQDSKTGIGGTGDNWAQYDFVLDEPDGVATRVSYETGKRSYFEDGDEVGVYVVNKDGSSVNVPNNSNVRYTVRTVTHLDNGETRQVLIPADPNVAVTKSPEYRYVLYYPFVADMTLASLKDYTHSIRLNQGEAGAYEASDLLWCYYTPPTDTDAYEVSFDHAMAQIVIELGGIYVPDIDESSAVKLLNMPTKAEKINLVQPLDELKYNPSFPQTDENMEISSWLFGKGAAEDNLQYRACVPAHTINADNPVVRVYYNQAEYKDYKIGKDLELKPGYTYTFTLSKEGVTVIDINDDDSWVLDVLDPETGEPVGLLCREYLRYQPQIPVDAYTEPDEPTGTIVSGDKKAINSQAWVFYALQDDGKTPELGRGTVLRFIYDVHENRNNVLDAAHFWPLPHTQPENQVHQGLFTPEHGFKWIQSPSPASNGNYYGVSSSEVDESLLADEEKEVNYNMHGGTVVWDGTNDKISSFIPVDDAPTNDLAKQNGHIAIDPETKEAKVSYASISRTDFNKDVDGKKVAVLVPRNLVDTRMNEDGENETTLYPLVKIGYNQFWISKPFHAKTLTDGTQLPCYNQKGTAGNEKPAGVTFNDDDYVDAGYIYPFAKNVQKADGTSTTYDPYNDPVEMAGPQGTEWDGRTSTYRPAPLYNKLAVENSRFVPVPQSSEYEYLMPTADEFMSMVNYFGYGFAAKLCTREIARSTGAQSLAYDRYTAIMRGETYSNNAGFYTANISGFNLRPMGYFYHEAKDGNSVGQSAAVILKSQTSVSPNSVAHISFESYDPWKDNPEVDFFMREDLNYGNYYTKYFAQVRLLMRFIHPTSGNAAVRSATRGGGGKAKSRNVWVQLVP